MKTFAYIQESTGKTLLTVKTLSWVLAEEYFETHFYYLPIVGYKTIEL